MVSTSVGIFLISAISRQDAPSKVENIVMARGGTAFFYKGEFSGESPVLLGWRPSKDADRRIHRVRQVVGAGVDDLGKASRQSFQTCPHENDALGNRMLPLRPIWGTPAFAGGLSGYGWGGELRCERSNYSSHVVSPTGKAPCRNVTT